MLTLVTHGGEGFAPVPCWRNFLCALFFLRMGGRITKISFNILCDDSTLIPNPQMLALFEKVL